MLTLSTFIRTFYAPRKPLHPDVLRLLYAIRGGEIGVPAKCGEREPAKDYLFPWTHGDKKLYAIAFSEETFTMYHSMQTMTPQEQVERDSQGLFVTGWKGGPGRSPNPMSPEQFDRIGMQNQNVLPSMF